MAWALKTTCQQCDKRLSKTDRALGPVCSTCVAVNAGRVWGKDTDDDYEEDGE